MTIFIGILLFVYILVFALIESAEARRRDPTSNLNEAGLEHDAEFGQDMGLHAGYDWHDPFEMQRRDEERQRIDFYDSDSLTLHRGLGIGHYDDSPSAFDDTHHIGDISSSYDASN